MTDRKSQRSATSHRPARIPFTLAVCALLPSLTTLTTQQPSGPAHVDAAHMPPEQHSLSIEDEGPVLSSSEIAQGAILLHFAHADGGLRLRDSGRGAFQIAGADHIWFPAEAHLVNGVVVVSTSLVQRPTAVRYTWSTFAAATLFNSEGRPAAPFHTDE